MIKEEPKVDKRCQLKKFPGKGGWTYASIPEILPNKKAPFGWVTIKGTIDHYELNHYKLMPMGNGTLFLPVKAAVRKKINKQEGDFVHIKLYLDNSSFVVPEELKACFKQEDPKIYKYFCQLPMGEQKAYVDWIYSTQKPQIKADRIIQMMNLLIQK